jgi:c-di-GMP-binding flagellar brake protein YcgR
MDTLPMPLGALASMGSVLDDCRITSRSEVSALLRRLLDSCVPLNLNAPDGATFTTTLWTIDSARELLSFDAHRDDPRLNAFVEHDEAVAVGYLDSIKVQFDVNRLVLVRGPRSSALSAGFPREMFRFQRRAGYRVRPMPHSTPMARLRHPMIPEMALCLRVLDVSIGGCALFLPDDIPPVQPGLLMNGAQIDLDADTRVWCALHLQHVTSLGAESPGVRLGCAIVNAGSEGLRALQRYIDQTQKQRRLLGA